jgi:putative CocE/NonD family hydrolase
MPFQVGRIPVLQKSTLPPETPGTNYTGPESSTTLLPSGHQKSPEWRALPSPIIFEHNVPLTLRDGTSIYADIFRPPNLTNKVPALLAWGPFGKSSVGLFSLDLIPGRSGIPKSSLSGYQNWEAPDPAEWIDRGYAIVNVDPRGVFDSEGSIRWFGTAEGRDGYDTVEEIAKMDWCDGSVAMVGNSWLAIAQWFIAAERAPSLKAIAPFEGASDIYRELLCRGGVSYLPFWGFLGGHLCGECELSLEVGVGLKVEDEMC